MNYQVLLDYRKYETFKFETRLEHTQKQKM